MKQLDQAFKKERTTHLLEGQHPMQVFHTVLRPLQGLWTSVPPGRDSFDYF